MNSTVAVSNDTPDVSIQLPPHGYKTLCLFNLLLSSIASVLIIILVLATTVPLLYPKRRKYYSTYNLYLAFMVLPELPSHILHVYLLLTHQQWIGNNDNNDNDSNYNTPAIESTNFVWMFDYQWDHTIYALAATSNLYVNAFLMHELFKLLKSSNIRKKHSPPTIGNVTQQAMVSYGVAIIYCLVDYGYSNVTEVKHVRFILYVCFSLIYVAVIPLSVMVWVSYRTYRQKLLMSTKSMYEGRLRILVIYFARIVLSDLLVWIPTFSCYLLYWVQQTTSPSKIIAYNLSLLFTPINVMVLFGCSMAKPDARKLITDLVCKFVYCRKGSYEDSDPSRRTSGRRLSSVTDPYLLRMGRASVEEPVAPPTHQVVAIEGNQFSSSQDPDDDQHLEPDEDRGFEGSNQEVIDSEV